MALAVALSGCGDEGTAPAPAGEDPVFPADYQQSFTMVRDCRFSIPHPSTITVHANATGAADYEAENYPLPEGTVLVKTLYADPACTAISGWVVMEKREAGFSPSAGDWFWQEVNGDGSVADSGVIQSCIGCHAACADRDWTCTEP